MTNDARRRFELVLDREIDVARQLATTLEAEREALTGNSPDAVAEKAARKNCVVGYVRTASKASGVQETRSSRPFRKRSDVAAQRWRALMERHGRLPDRE
jgi:hypothetical protein